MKIALTILTAVLFGVVATPHVDGLTAYAAGVLFGGAISVLAYLVGAQSEAERDG